MTALPPAVRPLAGARQEREQLAGCVRNLENAIQFADDSSLDQDLAITPAPPPENELREAMLRRVNEWRKVLLERHVEPCRDVLQRLVGRFELIDPNGLPDYIRKWIKDPDGLQVRPAFAALLRPEAFLDTQGVASPRGPGRFYTLRGVSARAA